MEYGLIDGIIGIDFLVKTNAVIDLAQMQLYEAIC